MEISKDSIYENKIIDTYKKTKTFKDIRKTSGLTQDKMSKVFCIPRRTIQSWEEGAREPAPYIIEMIKYILSNENIIGETKKSQRKK